MIQRDEMPNAVLMHKLLFSDFEISFRHRPLRKRKDDKDDAPKISLMNRNRRDEREHPRKMRKIYRRSRVWERRLRKPLRWLSEEEEESLRLDDD